MNLASENQASSIKQIQDDTRDSRDTKSSGYRQCIFFYELFEVFRVIELVSETSLRPPTSSSLPGYSDPCQPRQMGSLPGQPGDREARQLERESRGALGVHPESKSRRAPSQSPSRGIAAFFWREREPRWTTLRKVMSLRRVV